MSTTTSISSSSDVAYATGLAKAANLKRSLNTIGNAIDKGDMTGAGSKLAALIKAFPQYAKPSEGTSEATDPINAGFKAVSDAVAKNDTSAAKKAWTQLKSDLADAGVKSIDDGSADTAKLLADNRASMDQSLLSTMFGANSSSSNNILSVLTGTSAGSNSASDTVNSTISSWLTYQATGTSTTPTETGGGILNTTALIGSLVLNPEIQCQGTVTVAEIPSTKR
jgi:hypothetical protein